MRKIAFIVAAASFFAIEPIASRFGAVGSSVALVWMSVLLAIFASGSAQSLAIAAGAAGAFGSGVLAPVSPAAAGAVLVAAAFAERSTRVRSRTARAVHVLLALAAGALAGTLSTAFSGSSIPVYGVAVVVAAVLAALPLLVDADDPVAHALEIASGDVGEPSKASLLEAAELRRSASEIPLDRATEGRVKDTWKSLLRLAEARVRLERNRPRQLVRVATGDDNAAPATTAGAVLTMVDQRIADHVAALGKAYMAVDTAHAAAIGVDTTALEPTAQMGDSLEEVSRALVEVDDANKPAGATT
jgi:MFS family permease